MIDSIHSLIAYEAPSIDLGGERVTDPTAMLNQIYEYTSVCLWEDGQRPLLEDEALLEETDATILKQLTTNETWIDMILLIKGVAEVIHSNILLAGTTVELDHMSEILHRIKFLSKGLAILAQNRVGEATLGSRNPTNREDVPVKLHRFFAKPDISHVSVSEISVYTRRYPSLEAEARVHISARGFRPNIGDSVYYGVSLDQGIKYGQRNNTTTTFGYDLRLGDYNNQNILAGLTFPMHDRETGQTHHFARSRFARMTFYEAMAAYAEIFDRLVAYNREPKNLRIHMVIDRQKKNRHPN